MSVRSLPLEGEGLGRESNPAEQLRGKQTGRFLGATPRVPALGTILRIDLRLSATADKQAPDG